MSIERPAAAAPTSEDVHLHISPGLNARESNDWTVIRAVLSTLLATILGGWIGRKIGGCGDKSESNRASYVVGLLLGGMSGLIAAEANLRTIRPSNEDGGRPPVGTESPEKLNKQEETHVAATQITTVQHQGWVDSQAQKISV